MTAMHAPHFVPIWIALLAAYLAGSIPFGWLFTKFVAKVDVRTRGSGNIGATNVWRAAGKALGFATLVCDMLKGWAPVALATAFASGPDPALVALLCVLGHMFPVWLRFRGGKGVATAFGGILALSPWVGLVVGVVFALCLGLTRYVSLSSMVAAVGAPFALMGMGGATHAPFLGLVAVLILLKHHANLKRLLSHTEPRVRFRS